MSLVSVADAPADGTTISSRLRPVTPRTKRADR
jgi:hypothetical protein